LPSRIFKECVFNGDDGLEDCCEPFSFSSDCSAIFLKGNFFLPEGSDRCCAPFLILQTVQQYFGKETFFSLNVQVDIARLFYFL